jgi:hypothetical protein
MIKMGKESDLAPTEVLARAARFFGPDGVGLKIIDQDDCCARFQGSGGYVYVRISGSKDEGGTEVIVEGREWEHQIKQFVGQL